MQAVTLLMPLPCVANDGFKVGILGNPSQALTGVVTTANQAGGVPRATLTLHRRNGMPRHFSGCFNHLDRKSVV